MDTLFFYLSKLLWTFVSPLGLIIAGSALVLWLARPWARRGGLLARASDQVEKSVPAASPFALPVSRGRRWRIWLVGVCFWAALWAFSTPGLTQVLLGAWEMPLSAQDPGTFDALVVLGGTVIPDALEGVPDTQAGRPIPQAPEQAAPSGQGADSAAASEAGAFLTVGDSEQGSIPWGIQLNDTAERLVETARLFRQGAAPLVIVSGGSGDLYQPHSRESGLMKSFLMGMEVPSDQILEESQSRNTYENLVNTREILAKRGIKKVLVISSSLHLRRVQGICRKVWSDPGIHPAIAGGDSPGHFSQDISWDLYSVDSNQTRLGFPELILPSSLSFYQSSMVMRELVGYLSYCLMGYI